MQGITGGYAPSARIRNNTRSAISALNSVTVHLIAALQPPVLSKAWLRRRFPSQLSALSPN